MNASLLKQLNAHRRAREAAIVATHLETGTQHLFSVADKEKANGLADGLKDEIDKRFYSGKSGASMVDPGLFLGVYLPPPRLFLIGAVHIAQHIIAPARAASFDVVVIDPRTAFSTPERFHDVTLFADWPEDVLREMPLDPYCALAALTHDPKIDDYALKAALSAGCFYVGALGSRKTHATRRKRLIEEGVSADALDRIDAPIGLDIGAANPAEIAIAVLGSVISRLRGRA